MSKAPAPPDPYAVSNAQTQSNEQTANYEAQLNRVNQVTPLGSSTWDGTGPGATQTVTLAPQAQTDLTNQLNQDAALSQLGYNLTGQAGNSLQGSIDTSRLPALSGAPNAGPIQTSLTSPGNIQTSINSPGNVQSSLNYSNLPGITDTNSAINQAQNAVYGQAASRLDPQWTNAQNDLNAQLANQGIVQGSDAWNRAQDDFSRQKTDAYNQANFSAIQAGDALQNQLYGQQLSSRQQAQNEANTQGTFANAAQAQAYDQAANNAAFNNAAQGQQYSQAANNAAFGNEAQAQAFGQGATGAALNDQARAQGLTEQTNLQELPLNELNALRSQSQVQMPQFQPISPVGVQPTNVSGNVWNAYNANLANSNNFMSGLFGLGGALASGIGNAGGGAAFFSDRRLKRNLRRIGTTPRDRLPVYEFSYRGSKDRHVGILAQHALEVRPEAVSTHESGYLMVDYRKVA